MHDAKNAAEAAIRAKSVFLANMSHELRTPLNAILGFAQLISNDPTLPPHHQENLNIIMTSGTHLLRLINQVLDLSKIEANRMPINEEEVDLCQVLVDLEGMFRLRAAEKGLYWRIDRQLGHPYYARLDALKLRQVLINLLNNALKFTQQGGVTLRILDVGLKILDCTSSETAFTNHKAQITTLKFEISDTGPGVEPDEIATLFSAFHQTQTGRQIKEGTGLGLAISQQFVRLMGGTITVQSEIGRGTTFAFEIPVYLLEVPRPGGVQVVYEENPETISPPSQEQYRLTPEALAVLPENWRKEFLEMVEMANLDRALALANQLRQQYPEISMALEKLLKAYRFDILQDVLERIAGHAAR